MSARESVIVVGAGPVGLWLAAELALAGVPVLVVERRPEPRAYSRALGIHARTLEVFGMRGVVGHFLAEGLPLQDWHFGMLRSPIDLRSLDTDYPYLLALPQQRTEELLELHATDLGVSVLRNRAVVGLTQHDDFVSLHLDGSRGAGTLRADYVIGADGSGSAVRQFAGIDFPGTEPTTYGYLGDVMLDAPPPGQAVREHSAEGALIALPMGDGRYRITGIDARHQHPGEEFSFEALRDITVRMLGTDLGMRDPSWLSRFSDRTNLANTYRSGRVLLAGDAAHLTWPAGSVGLNVGIQDAMNLGWKLAAVIQERADPGLLDTYHAERRPVGAALAQHSLAQGALINATSVSGQALRGWLSNIVDQHPAVGHAVAEELSGLDVRYPTDDARAHSLVGRRVPDVPIDDGGRNLFTQMSCGRAVLMNIAGTDWPKARIKLAKLGIPVVRPGAEWAAPDWSSLGALLVRPDGHVAWASAVSADLEGEVIRGVEEFAVTFSDRDDLGRSGPR